jgi:hypothetical protein
VKERQRESEGEKKEEKKLNLLTVPEALRRARRRVCWNLANRGGDSGKQGVRHILPPAAQGPGLVAGPAQSRQSQPSIAWARSMVRAWCGRVNVMVTDTLYRRQESG